MGDRRMILGIELGKSYGVHPGAWRMPGADSDAYTTVDSHVRGAQAAERGGLDFLFFPDRVFLHGNPSHTPPNFAMEPMLVLAVVARETSRIGLVASASTSFNEPYTLARQFRALDVMSNGRAGWNSIPSFEPEAFANYGRPLPAREDKYERLHETIQITQALWGSWDRAAGRPDPASGRYADPKHIRPVNLQGRHVGSRGPIQIPPSEQGQPVILMPAASGSGLQAAGMYANVIFGGPATIDECRMQQDIARSAARAGGRTAEDVKFLAFMNVGLGATKRDALDRRRALEEHADLPSRLAQLSMLLGVEIDAARADEPLTPQRLAHLRPHPGAARSAQAADLARDGWSPLDILAHGVLDPGAGVVGTPDEAADLMQEWFEAGVCDGFIFLPDDQRDNIDDIANMLVPILRRRGLRAADYQGTTLRDHLGLPEQLGIDPRLAHASE